MGKVGCDIWEKWVGGRKRKSLGLTVPLLSLSMALNHDWISATECFCRISGAIIAMNSLKSSDWFWSWSYCIKARISAIDGVGDGATFGLGLALVGLTLFVQKMKK